MTQTLNQQLEQYNSMVKTTVRGVPQAVRISAYAAAGVALGAAGTAEAGIIYSGIQNVTVAAAGNSGIHTASIDVDGGGADLQLVVVRSAGAFGLAFLNPLVGAVAADPSSLTKFASGGTIGSGAAFDGGSVAAYGNVGGTFIGNFNFSSNGFAGFQLASGNFGWIRLHTATQAGGSTTSLDALTAIDWAYEDSGASIQAGAGVPSGGTAPAPSALALLAAGVGGIAAFRRRKNAAAKQATALHA